MILSREGMEIRPVGNVNGREGEGDGSGQRFQCVKSSECITLLRAFCLDVM